MCGMGVEDRHWWFELGAVVCTIYKGNIRPSAPVAKGFGMCRAAMMKLATLLGHHSVEI